MNVLIVEDDDLLAEYTRRTLRAQHHYVQVTHDGELGLKKALSGTYDVVILDLLLPRKSGVEICSELRRRRITTPIIVLTSLSDEKSKLLALDVGADDYMTKPFSNKELAARLRAVTRRPALVVQSLLTVNDLILDPQSHTIRRAGKLIKLQPREYKLLEYMMRNPDIALPKHSLLSNVWKIRSEAASNRLEVCIKQLRQKIDQPFERKLIYTVRGVGYKIVSSNTK